MVTISYSLTPEDYAELERQRRGGVSKRIVRVGFGVFAGVVGVSTIWQIITFPWKNHPFGNLLFVAMGLFCIWGGFEMPGLASLLLRISDPYAPQAIRIDDGNITGVRGGKLRQFQWHPGRGFSENEKFFFLRALSGESKWAIPKRAVTHEQELNLRELIRKEPGATAVG